MTSLTIKSSAAKTLSPLPLLLQLLPKLHGFTGYQGSTSSLSLSTSLLISPCSSPTALPSLLQEMTAAANRALTQAKMAGSLARPAGGGRATARLGSSTVAGLVF